MFILEKIYANFGKGYSDYFKSSGLDNSLNKIITPLAVHKGDEIRFIYKLINNKCVFIQSIFLKENDSFDRGGMYLSHFIIIDDSNLFNPEKYILSPSFVTTFDQVDLKKKEIINFKCNKELKPCKAEIVLSIVNCIIKYIPSNKSLVIILNEKNIDDIIYSVFNLIPNYISSKISFSLNTDKITKNNICDLNFSSKKISSSVKKDLMFLTEDDMFPHGEYVGFVSKLPENEKTIFFSFLSKVRYSLEDIDLSIESFSINKLKKFKTNNQQSIINTVMGITTKSTLVDFLKICTKQNIYIDNHTLTKIDSVIYERFYRGYNKNIELYFKFLTKVSIQENKYFTKRYNRLLSETDFWHLICQYDYEYKEFISLINFYGVNTVKLKLFCSEFMYHKSIVFIKMDQLSSLQLKMNPKNYILNTAKKEMEIVSECMNLIINCRNELKKDYLISLINTSTRGIYFIIFIVTKYRNLIDKDNLAKLFLMIEAKVTPRIYDSSDFIKFVTDNDFSGFNGLLKIKHTKVKYLLKNKKIHERELDKIIKLISQT